MPVSPALAIRCQGLTKGYGHGPARVRALRGVDLVVRSGELFMLVGPSGCGKTTLISIVSGILDQDDGRGEVLGRTAGAMAPAERASFRGRYIGFVLQVFNLLAALTAAENVAVPLLISGWARKRMCARAEVLLEQVGLGRAGHGSGCQSGGLRPSEQIAQLALRRTMAPRPARPRPSSANVAGSGTGCWKTIEVSIFRSDATVCRSAKNTSKL